ncbi:hypothetical protein AXG93_1052s1200 [Marchantia polymorpha subsp. ruderalis]|uniref:Late embryogenesis abundant protein LEA-2 subgroup domain-containing protein n=1 Tax=Marchantia polymorpha subsp. ruderalis TaxID=1480154 RepID=A0A176VU69_MARPO|nr:hypothetical protein AXG93_1052s1200 [Marchantia polymorpha subsp. ruderalis]
MQKEVELGSGKEGKGGMDRESRGTEPFAVPSPMREPKPGKRSRKKCVLCCCGICTAVIVLVIVILIILAFTVFKPKDPELTVNSVTLNGLDVNLANILTSPNPSVGIDLDTKVTVKNPNYASFKYRNTTAYIYYHGKEIGDSSIEAGEIKSRSSAQLDLPVSVKITGDLFNSNLTTDLLSGILPVATRVEIRGTANFLNIIKLKNARLVDPKRVEAEILAHYLWMG